MAEMMNQNQQGMGGRMILKLIVVIVLVGLGMWGYNYFFSRRVISVVGVGKESVAANKATIVFAYSASGTSQDDAVSKGEQGLNGAIAALTPISPTEVKKIQYQIQPRYNTSSATNEYLYVSGASVTISGGPQIAQALKLLSVPNVQVSAVSYLPDNKDEADKKAQDAAIADARKRAENIAKATGGRIGKVLSVSEQGSNAQTGSAVTSVGSGTANEPLQTVEIQSAMTVSFELN